MRQLLFFYFNSSLNGELFYGEHFMLTETKRTPSATGATICLKDYRRPAFWVDANIVASIFSARLPRPDKILLLSISEATHRAHLLSRNTSPWQYCQGRREVPRPAP